MHNGGFADELANWIGIPALLLGVWAIGVKTLSFLAGGVSSGAFSLGNPFAFWPFALVVAAPFVLTDTEIFRLRRGVLEEDFFNPSWLTVLFFVFAASPIILNGLHWGALWWEKPNLAEKLFAWRFEILSWSNILYVFIGGILLYLLTFAAGKFLPRTRVA